MSIQPEWHEAVSGQVFDHGLGSIRHRIATLTCDMVFWMDGQRHAAVS